MLDIRNISKTFEAGTINEKKALINFSLNVKDEDFISIIGSNGAGKSTLFNAIAGSFTPDCGSIHLDGKDITWMPEHRRSAQIGRLMQDPMKGTAPHMSIEENLFLAAGKGGWFNRITRKEKNEFRERLSLLGMGLEERMKSPVGLLSGGQRQALTLLMATYNPPKLLLLDEHTAALDPETASKVTSITSRIISENHITCLMITHNMSSALELGNRLIIMNSGRIVFDARDEEKKSLTVDALLSGFKKATGRALDNDRMRLSAD